VKVSVSAVIKRGERRNESFEELFVRVIVRRFTKVDNLKTLSKVGLLIQSVIENSMALKKIDNSSESIDVFTQQRK
jgi:hypothetical protein